MVGDGEPMVIRECKRLIGHLLTDVGCEHHLATAGSRLGKFRGEGCNCRSS